MMEVSRHRPGQTSMETISVSLHKKRCVYHDARGGEDITVLEPSGSSSARVSGEGHHSWK